MSQAVFSSLPTSVCPVIFAPRHFDVDQQQSWSLSFFALPALAISLVALVSIATLTSLLLMTELILHRSILSARCFSC